MMFQHFGHLERVQFLLILFAIRQIFIGVTGQKWNKQHIHLVTLPTCYKDFTLIGTFGIYAFRFINDQFCLSVSRPRFILTFCDANDVFQKSLHHFHSTPLLTKPYLTGTDILEDFHNRTFLNLMSF